MSGPVLSPPFPFLLLSSLSPAPVLPIFLFIAIIGELSGRLPGCWLSGLESSLVSSPPCGTGSLVGPASEPSVSSVGASLSVVGMKGTASGFSRTSSWPSVSSTMFLIQNLA